MAFPRSRDEEPPKRDDGGWIDVHHHCYQPELVAALRDSGVTQMAPGVPLPEWTAADSLRVMDSTGLSAAVLSVLLPDGDYDTAAAARLANDQSASVAADHPGRFAALASLPLPDVEATLAEMDYALDGLSMDGVVLSASLSDGRLLGDPAFTEVFDELNRRQAVAFIHPRPGYRCTCTAGAGFAELVPPPLVDFIMDTTRAVAGLVYGGTLRRWPGIRFIVAHAGGAVPYLAGRLELAGTWILEDNTNAASEAVAEGLRNLYYETAQSFAPGTLACLQAITDASHILFGTDYPFMGEEVIASGRQVIAEYGRLSPAAVGRENALALFPRLKTRPHEAIMSHPS